MERIQSHRKFYADLVTAAARVPAGNKLVDAFASVPRERFVGQGPWKVHTNRGYIETSSDDPTFLYQNIAVALKETDLLNNGLPSTHALCLSTLDIQEGQTIIHIGAGTGYYTAILAEMVGLSGSVHAYEIESAFYADLARNLSAFPQVVLHQASGTESALPTCDGVYVNAGATSPLPVWLDALSHIGRLIFPLTPERGSGGVLMITKRSLELAPARFLTLASFAPCIGGRKKETARRLTDAFCDPRWNQVQSYRRGGTPDNTCWFADDDWWLSTEMPAAEG